MCFPILKKRSQFVRVSKGGFSFHYPGFVVQVLSFPTGEDIKDSPIQVGFTASKKVGSAVYRNRAKRRLRSLIGMHWEEIKHTFLNPTHIVLIAKGGAFRLPFATLEKDFLKALTRVSSGDC